MSLFFNFHGPLNDLTFLLLFSIKTIADTPFIQLVLRSFALYVAWAHHSQTKTTDALGIRKILLGSNVTVNTNADARSEIS